MKHLEDAEIAGVEFAGADSLKSLRELPAADLLKRFGAFVSTQVGGLP